MTGNFKSHAGGERFFPNTVSLAAYTLIGTLLTLLQVKLLAGYLTREAFGLFASLRGFAVLIAMLSANGIPALLVRFLPVHETRGDRRAALWLSIISLLLTILLYAIGVLAVQGTRSHLLGFVPKDVLSTRLIFWFYVTALGTALKLVTYGGLNGMRRLTHQVILETASISAILIWIYLKRNGLDVEMLFRIFGSVSLATALLALPILFSFFPLARTKGSEPKASNGPREYGAYWLGALGLSLVAVAFTDFDRYLLSNIIVLELLALFHIGARIIKLANRIMGVPILAFQPEITRVQAEGRRQRVLVATKVLMKFNTAVSIFITIALIVFSREIIVVVANRNYLGAEPLLVILCLSLPFSSLTAPVTAVMKAFDQVRGAFYCDLAWAVVYIGLLFALGIPFGIIGLGLAQVLACAVQLLLALLISNLNLRYGFIIGLAAKLTAGGIAAFLPFLALEISRDLWRSALLFYIIKVVLFIPALFCFNWIIRKIEIFDSGDKTVLSAIFDKRGLGVFSRLF